jgi:hypothetical protein
LQIVDDQQVHFLELAFQRGELISPDGLDQTHSQIAGRDDSDARQVRTTSSHVRDRVQQVRLPAPWRSVQDKDARSIRLAVCDRPRGAPRSGRRRSRDEPAEREVLARVHDAATKSGLTDFERANPTLVPFQMLAQLVVDVALRFHNRIDLSLDPIGLLNQRQDIGIDLRQVLIDPHKMLIDPVEALIDSVEALIDLREAVVDTNPQCADAACQHVELVFDSIEPFFRHGLLRERGRRLYHRRRRCEIAMMMPS